MSDWLIERVEDLFSYESKLPDKNGVHPRVKGVALGHTPSTKHPEYYANGNIDWVRIEDVDGKYVETTGKKISLEGFLACSTKMIPAQTCVMTVTKTVGKTGILKSPMAISQSVVAFLPNPGVEVDPEYLYYYLPTVFVPKVVTGEPGEIGKREVDATIIKIPKSLELQRQIAEKIRNQEQLLDEMSELLARNMDNLEKLRLNLVVKYLPE